MNRSFSTQLQGRLESRRATSLTLLDQVETYRINVSAAVAQQAARQAELGQYFTPENIARFMAAMVHPCAENTTLRLLDAGCGNGVLTAAFVSDVCSRWTIRPREISVTLWEVDEGLAAEIRRTLALCTEVCDDEGIKFTADLRLGDFIKDASAIVDREGLFATRLAPFDVAILNPPYRKLRSDSEHRASLRSAGIETSNLYAAFIWLAMELLGENGQMVAITPRSYMNGSYFRPLRRALLRGMSFQRVHVYETRDTAFSDDEVLQENAIIHATKGAPRAPVLITTSSGPEDDGVSSRLVEAKHFVSDDDPDAVMHVVPDETDARISERMRGLPATLDDLSLSVSTGRVVEFRARERLRSLATESDTPLIFPRHLASGFVAWPQPTGSKAEAIVPRSDDDPDLMPAGWYIVVKRFSSKEEPRRVVAALYDPERNRRPFVAFDNKLNVFHRGGQGLPPSLARGLAVFLNSTLVDAYFRQFSGHTQVNAGDLRSLRYPDVALLERLGRAVTGTMPTESEINELIREEMESMGKGEDPVATKKKVESAIGVLKALGVPKEQQNERSALTLLALLDLAPNLPWARAKAPSLGVTEIMEWMASKYGKQYAANTRETIRRYTLHQFIEVGIVVLNPDEPGRAPNSPKNVYQIEPGTLTLLQTVGTNDWAKNLAAHAAAAGGKNRLRETARQMTLIPVTLPTGETIELSGGGQNVLIKEIIERFAPRFTPGGHVAYVGDAGEKHLLHDTEYLKVLGVVTDRHGKMPDVVIHFRERNWLVLVEAVTSHGPVNRLRHNQLKALFSGSKPGLVYVTAFLDRRAMREYLPEIAWETEVWVADAPEHLIHFNGERFLGPYSK